MKNLLSIAGFLALIVIIATTYCYIKIPKAGAPLSEDIVADLVTIDKSEHTLTLFKSRVVLKVYQVSLGRGGPEPKEREGDKKTPEGHYTIDRRNDKSSFYKSLHVSYPDATDVERAKQADAAAGSDIMIHGLRNGVGFVGRLHLLVDWTQGCIAVTNAEMDELWRSVPDGTPVKIAP